MAKQPRHKTATKKMVRPQEVESGLFEFAVLHLDASLVDSAFALEVIGLQEEREKIMSVLETTNFGRLVDRAWNELIKDAREPKEVLLSILRTGFSLGMRTVDLVVIRRRS